MYFSEQFYGFYIHCLFALELNRIQADTLWSCLAMDSECSDDCLSWFLQQVKSNDHHAMSDSTLRYLFIEKVG